MCPRTGRPPKAGVTKGSTLTIRLTESEAELIKKCAEQYGLSRTEVVLLGIKKLMEK